MDWNGHERRIPMGCPLHGGLVDWIKDEREEIKGVMAKLDKLIDRQTDHHDEIMYIKNIVSDGLQSDVKKTAQRVDEICKTLNVLEGFKWFGVWINDLRDHTFLHLLKYSAIGGIAFIAIHVGNKFMVWLLK